jgi:hypothetical protein
MKGREFERAIGAYLRSQGWTVDDQPRGKLVRLPGGRVISSPVDFLGCIDVIAIHPERGLWFIQAGTRVSPKRKDVEKVPWPKPMLTGLGAAELRVSVFEAADRPDDLHRRRKVHLARVHDLRPNGSWQATEVLQVHPLPSATKATTLEESPA